MFGLRRNRRNMPFVSDPFFLRPWSCRDATIPAVVTHASRGVVDHAGVVDVMDVGNIHIVNGTVVEESPVVPATALIAFAKVSETIVNAAVEPNSRSPI